MIVYLEKFKVVYPEHPLHGKTLDFIIKNGKFDKIGKNLKPTKVNKTISKGFISPGWVDVGTHLTAPGFEHRDTVASLLDTAAAGGYTDIITLSNTNPSLDNASTIRSVITMASDHAVRLHPLGATSINNEGNSLVEMHDMKDAGAVGFTDGNYPITDEGNLYRTLQYARAVDTTVVNQSKLENLAQGWQMNEGDVNVRLGLTGQPSIVEDIAVNRDLQVNTYASGKLLFHKLSSPSALNAIISHKKKAEIYSSVSYLNLVLNDQMLETFDSNYKVDPPLRSQSAINKLCKQVMTNKVDIIISDHCPLDQETKLVEFDQAGFGAIGLQTCYAAINTNTEIDTEAFVNCVALNPRSIFGIELPRFEEGAIAEITLFDPKQEFVLGPKTNKSKSQNSPFWNMPLKGKILGIFVSGRLIENI